MMHPTLSSKANIANLTLIFTLTACGSINSPNQVGARVGINNKAVKPQSSSQGMPASQSGNQTTESQEMLPPADLKPIRPVPGAAIAYDFLGTLSRESQTAAVARMILQTSSLNVAKRVKVKGTLVNLKSSSLKQPLEREVDVIPGGVVDFTIKNLSPETVYRLENVSIADISTASAQGNITSVKDPYFLSTTSDSKLSKARRRLVIEALNEAYDWDHGNYDSSKQYASGWGWCDYFYTWATGHEFNVRAGYGSTSFFRRYGALGDAEKIPSIAATESLAGDLIRYEGTREGTHSFMIIAYDADTKSLWNVEGNYNRRVMRSQRKINSPWMHGHLTEEQVR